MRQSVVSWKKDGAVGIIELAAPKKNALTADSLEDLERAFIEVDADDGVRVVLLAGKGGAFCSGMDIEWLRGGDSHGMIRATVNVQRVFRYIESFRKPVVAEIRGPAIGGGLLLALVCDYRVAAADALLGLPEVKVGIPIFLAGAKILQRFLPLGKMKELLFWGDLFDGKEAEKLGLVNECAPEDQVREVALGKARVLAESSPLALQLLKRGIGASYEMSQQALLAMELDTLGFFWQSEDRKEGLSAFLEKRRAAFKGV
ncbi:MAG: enoyl-CoA hydratase/isomerase family protein [Deltaproteobacteria bacterium]|nr:enoyl-CoA hydratase/isomerase family protein [Deltaproteobacteria bacterium]